MPCRDEGYTTQEEYEISAENDNLRNRLDFVTRLLCEVLTSFDKNGNVSISKECSMWWESHKESDRKRVEAERVAKEKRIKEVSQKSKKLKDELKKLQQELQKLSE